jgi:uncharacterized membrane protein YbaN (DUF454 family)
MKHLYNILGMVAVSVGAIGIVIPVLPTTPFILLAAGCFAKGSPRLHTWLSETKYFGSFIRNYRDKTGVPVKDKAVALMFLWTVLTISVVVMSKVFWMDLLLVAVGIAVTVHILMLKTRKTDCEPDN